MVSIVKPVIKRISSGSKESQYAEMQREYTMSNQKNHLTVSDVRKQYTSFFERVMVLYNLTLSKNEKDHDVEDVKRFATELYDTGRIDDYDKKVIKEALEDSALLLTAESNKWDIDLEYLEARISLATDGINAEIGALIH